MMKKFPVSYMFRLYYEQWTSRGRITISNRAVLEGTGNSVERKRNRSKWSNQSEFSEIYAINGSKLLE